LVQASSDLTDAKGPLLLAKGALDLRSVLPAFPRHSCVGVNAIDHDVHVSVLAVVVRHHQCLMLGKSEVAEHAVSDALHLLWRDVVLVIEADREVIDGHLYEGALPRSRLHERRGQRRVVSAQVAARCPRDAVRLGAGAAGDEMVASGPKRLPLEVFAITGDSRGACILRLLASDGAQRGAMVG
jgi:hypothetical protein